MKWFPISVTFHSGLWNKSEPLLRRKEPEALIQSGFWRAVEVSESTIESLLSGNIWQQPQPRGPGAVTASVVLCKQEAQIMGGASQPGLLASSTPQVPCRHGSWFQKQTSIPLSQAMALSALVPSAAYLSYPFWFVPNTLDHGDRMRVHNGKNNTIILIFLRTFSDSTLSTYLCFQVNFMPYLRGSI